MNKRNHRKFLTLASAFLALQLIGSASFGQTDPATDPFQFFNAVSFDASVAPIPHGSTECPNPAPLLSIDDYDSPFKCMLSFISRKTEITTVDRPLYPSDTVIAPLKAREKFHLFMTDTFEPTTLVVAGFEAGRSRTAKKTSQAGRGPAAFGIRYAASLTDELSTGFLGTFLFPSLLHQDPRYFRMSHGTPPRRLLHAASHVLIAKRDNDRAMFNFPEWLGTVGSTALSNLYHPGSVRGFPATARSVAFSIGLDMGFDVLREFWPEVSHRLHVPLFAQGRHLSRRLN